MLGAERPGMRILAITFMLFLTLGAYSLADETSGPGRTTLQRVNGVTVYAVTNRVAGTKTSFGETVLTTAGGKVTLRPSVDGLQIVGPKGTIKVTNSLGEIRIVDGKKTIKVKTQTGGKTVIDIPGQPLTFNESLNDTTVTGSDGVLKVTNSMNELKLVSPAGTTVYKTEVDGLARNGPPVDDHPYTYRALLLLERDGVGILLDLLPYQNQALRPFLDWDRVKKID
jgi:hypothetical protein